MMQRRFFSRCAGKIGWAVCLLGFALFVQGQSTGSKTRPAAVPARAAATASSQTSSKAPASSVSAKASAPSTGRLSGKTASTAASKKTAKFEPKVIYRFSEHLADAQTEVYLPEKEERKPGKWDGNQLAIGGLSGAFGVQKTVQAFGKELKQVISMRTIPDAVRILCFHDVPPGATMVLYTGFSDTDGAVDGTVSTVYMTVWTGIHRLTRIPVPTTPGWSSVELDLGAVAFLMKNIVVTFEVTIDERTGRKFSFDAEILG